MSVITTDSIKQALKTFIDPLVGQDLMTMDAVKSVVVQDNAVALSIKLGYPFAGVREKMRDAIRHHLAPITANVEVSIEWEIQAQPSLQGVDGISGVKNIIAVSSAKGGVGKSTTTVNVALALQKEGARVGILDADIYGPNQPHMLGAKQRPDTKGDKTLMPVVSHGVQSMSIGYLIDTTTPMIWRGPMVSSALQQLLRETVWEDLDYLFIDLPPGTGDIQLTLVQKVPVSGAIIVTTPQDIALLDARKGLEMFRKVKVPVLGIIENMSTHVCAKCGHEEAIFGQGGGERMANDTNVPLLGQLPLDLSIRQAVDNGCPTVAEDPESTLSKMYRDIARKMAAQLTLCAHNETVKIPEIIIE